MGFSTENRDAYVCTADFVGGPARVVTVTMTVTVLGVAGCGGTTPAKRSGDRSRLAAVATGGFNAVATLLLLQRFNGGFQAYARAHNTPEASPQLRIAAATSQLQQQTFRVALIPRCIEELGTLSVLAGKDYVRLEGMKNGRASSGRERRGYMRFGRFGIWASRGSSHDSGGNFQPVRVETLLTMPLK